MAAPQVSTVPWSRDSFDRDVTRVSRQKPKKYNKQNNIEEGGQRVLIAIEYRTRQAVAVFLLYVFV